MNYLANKHNKSGRKFLDRGKYKAAEKQFLKAIESAPNWSVPWYNLGLVYKKQMRWAESLNCNQHATQFDSNDKAAWWNMGIAATALGKWSEARQAWAGFGVQLPPGNGPLKMSLGPTPIRLNPKSNSEVVWCDRIDPARAIIKNVPLPNSQHCFGDILLHDGEPRGYRLFQGQEVPVFDALELLEPSPYKTYALSVLFRSLEDVEVLMDMASQVEMFIEDWASIRKLCKLCSEGKPHEHHKMEPTSQAESIQLGIAAQSEDDVYQLCEKWSVERPSCKLSTLECAFSH